MKRNTLLALLIVTLALKVYGNIVMLSSRKLKGQNVPLVRKHVCSNRLLEHIIRICAPGGDIYETEDFVSQEERRQGIIDACCNSPCSLSQMYQYCPWSRRMVLGAIPSFPSTTTTTTTTTEAPSTVTSTKQSSPLLRFLIEVLQRLGMPGKQEQDEAIMVMEPQAFSRVIPNYTPEEIDNRISTSSDVFNSREKTSGRTFGVSRNGNQPSRLLVGVTDPPPPVNVGFPSRIRDGITFNH